MASGPMLETDRLTIRFGGHVAVDAVSCAFEPGTLTSIVGPNGAGKTTYFNLISGQLSASSGTVKLHGADITGLSAPRRTRLGLGRAFQLTNLFPNLTALENVRLAVQVKSGRALDLFSRAEKHRDLVEKAMTHLEAVSLANRAGAVAATLPHGDQRKLEVAILLALEPDVFMFDEPTAGMSVDEVPTVLDIIARIKARGDKTILLVEHKMDVVRTLSDRIVVLHHGKLVADGAPNDVINSDVVREAYLGGAAEPSR
jgi:branched-chain amino acid transport system ATP-binding protein